MAEPQIKDALAFIAALTGRPDTSMRFRFLPDDKSKKLKPAERYGTVETMWSTIRDHQARGYGIFYVVNVTKPLPDGTFSKDEDVIKVRAVFIDCDHGLPEPYDYAGNPTMIVRTSPGKGQVIWRIEGIEPDEFETLQRRLAFHYKSDVAVVNPSRVLRLPGTLHQKGEPHLVTFETMGVTGDPFNGVANLDPALASDAAGEPVPWEVLVETLDHIDPDVGYGEWRDRVAAIHATNSGTEAEREALAREWSRVDTLDPDGMFASVWETMPPKVGGVGFGTLYQAAKLAGHTPNINPPKASAEIWDAKVLQAAHPKILAKLPDTSKWVKFAETRNWDVPPVQEVIEGLVEKGLTTFLAGPGGSNKSRLAVQWGLCIDAGRPIFGRVVEPAIFNYLSYEDAPEEVTRRVQAIQKKLDLPDGGGMWRDLTQRMAPLAIVNDEGLKPMPFYLEFGEHLTKQAGHHFIVLDSTYDVFQFQGNSKINESAVHDAIQFLDRFCEATDSTILCLWHPSRSGMERGDASGWSVAWENKPRARLSLTIDKKNTLEEIFMLDVVKRNNAAKLKQPIALRWDDGVLAPVGADTMGAAHQSVYDAIVELAVACALNKSPLKDTSPPDWVLAELRRQTGQNVDGGMVRNVLSQAGYNKVLTYIHNTKGGRDAKPAGWYPSYNDADGEGDHQGGTPE